MCSALRHGGGSKSVAKKVSGIGGYFHVEAVAALQCRRVGLPRPVREACCATVEF
jgi:hypothetical protein